MLISNGAAVIVHIYTTEYILDARFTFVTIDHLWLPFSDAVIDIQILD